MINNTTVITYYQPFETTLSTQSSELVERWKSNWLSKGWTPIVLTEEYAKRNPLYKRIQLETNKTFFLKNKEYHRQCFMRWLAYSQFVFENGPSVWADYDVYNQRFTVECFNNLTRKSKKESRLFCSAGSCGLMNTLFAEEVLDLIYRISVSSSIEDVRFLNEEEKSFFVKNSQVFNDMYIVKWVFLKGLGYNRKWPFIASCLMTNKRETKKQHLKRKNITEKEYFERYYLFHLHGGILDKDNKEYLLLPNYLPESLKTRSDLWDYISETLVYK